MLEFINANPGVTAIVTIVLGLAALGGIQWKVLRILFLEPRDEELERLKRRVEEMTQAKDVGMYMEGSAISGEATNNESKPRSTAVPSIDTDPFESLASFRQMARRRDITELQRQAMLQQTIGIQVEWRGSVDSVSEHDDGSLSVMISDLEDPVAPAFCDFDKTYRDRLAKLKRDDVIRVKGTIKRSEGLLSLGNCQIMDLELGD